MTVQLTYCTHSVSTDNEQGIATGWRPGELSATGRRQAAELGESLASESIDAVFTSDLTRAVQTVQIALPGRPFITDKRLRECNYGDLNGASTAVVHAQQREHIEIAFPNGESYRDVQFRMADFTAMLRREHDGERVLVVSHMAPQLALNVIVHGLTWPEAFDTDWRLVAAWQPGWRYVVA